MAIVRALLVFFVLDVMQPSWVSVSKSFLTFSFAVSIVRIRVWYTLFKKSLKKWMSELLTDVYFFISHVKSPNTFLISCV